MEVIRVLTYAPLQMDTVAALEQRLQANRREQEELRGELAEREREEGDLVAQLAAAAAAAGPSQSAAPRPLPPARDWAGAFEWDGQVDQLLEQRFGHREFRPLQREVLNATLSGEDCFAVLPTGAGKTLLFQLPAFMRPGLTLVISPLVSLMEDQIARLETLGLPAALLAAELTDRARSTQIQNDAANPAVSGLRLLYVTPERVAKSKLLMSRLQKAYQSGQLARIAVDEAHCCSAQGHDFRPDFLQLGSLRANFPETPILALTATASVAVGADVETILQMGQPAPGGRVARFRGHL